MDPIALATAIVGLITAFFGARTARSEARTSEKKASQESQQDDIQQLETLISRIEEYPLASPPLATLRLEPHRTDAAVQLTEELGNLFAADTPLANLAESTYQTMSPRNRPIIIADTGAVAFESIKMQGRYVAGRDIHINNPPE